MHHRAAPTPKHSYKNVNLRVRHFQNSFKHSFTVKNTSVVPSLRCKNVCVYPVWNGSVQTGYIHQHRLCEWEKETAKIKRNTSHTNFPNCFILLQAVVCGRSLWPNIFWSVCFGPKEKTISVFAKGKVKRQLDTERTFAHRNLCISLENPASDCD